LTLLFLVFPVCSAFSCSAFWAVDGYEPRDRDRRQQWILSELMKNVRVKSLLKCLMKSSTNMTPHPKT